VKNGLKYNESENKFVKIYLESGKLIIQDNGVGLSQKQFEKISFNYISKKNKDIDKETSGLGLNICQTIMSEHGYELTCEKNDIGTKITINLS
jgi:signal transduction histidine kinase